MTTECLVIAGCLGIGIERCWKRLFEDQWYFLKSWFVKPVAVLFKENSWSFDLKHLSLLGVIDHPGPFLSSLNARIGGCKPNLFQKTSYFSGVVVICPAFIFLFLLVAL